MPNQAHAPKDKLREVYKDYLSQPGLIRSKTTFDKYLQETRYRNKPGHYAVQISKECGFSTTKEFRDALSNLTL